MVENKRKTGQENNTTPDHSARRLLLLARIILILNIVLVIAGASLSFVFTLTYNLDTINIIGGIFNLAIVLTNGIVALLILSRYPKHTIGWLLLLLSLLGALFQIGLFFDLIAENSIETIFPHLLADLISWNNNLIYLLIFNILLIFIPLYFPTGRLLSPRWRIVTFAGIALIVLSAVGTAIHPGPFEWDETAINPIQIPDGAAIGNFLNDLSIPFGIFAVAGTLASIFLRYRRAAADERAQMKWVFYVLVLGIVFLTTTLLLESIVPDAYFVTVANLGSSALFLLAIMIPITIGIAILRYRLFDIDLIIRRTLVYGLVTLALVAVYFGSVVLLQQFFSGVTDQQSPLAIVISTLFIAALFNPLRRRVQDAIDRRFFRRKYDAAQTLAQFAKTARDEVDLEKLVQAMQRTVEQTMQPESISIWLSDHKADKRRRSSS